MRSFFVLLDRELKSYFYSPIAYVVLCFFLIATGLTFTLGVLFLNQAPREVTVVQSAFNGVLFWFTFILVFPLLTMRTYADEFRTGTIETLTTAPVSDWAVVLAKFGGALFFYCILWLPSVAYFIGFQWITGKEAAMAAGAYWGSYLLLFLIGMFYISIGCLASAVTTEQINAAIASFVIVFGVFVFALTPLIFNVTDPNILQFFGYFSTLGHMGDFSRGVIDSRPIVWYVSMTALVLFINLQVFQFRKWKA